MEIELARWTDADLDLLRAFNDPEMRRHLGGPEDEEKVAARHRRFVDWTEPGGAYRVDLVPDVGERVPVGGIVYWEREWAGERVYEAGWSVLPAYQGRGIASVAIEAVLARARAEGRLRYLYAFPSVDNPSSNAVCRKAGFELTGESDFEYPPGHFLRSNVWRHDLRSADSLLLRPIGRVESPLKDLADAPRQGDEGGADAWLVFDPTVAPGLTDLRIGADVLVLTWLDRADRDVLRVHPRGDTNRPETGVFATRSPDRPNPIGLHRVIITAVDGERIGVRPLEAVDGTPILDVKPVLGAVGER